MPVQELCKVKQAEHLTEHICSLWIETARIAAQAHPGQFIHIACGADRLLRRPISICDVQGSAVRIVFQIKGAGTAWLAERRTEDMLDVLGALGHGYEPAHLGTRPVLLGGGIGVPPLLYAAKEAGRRGAKPIAVLGFRNHDAVILEQEFRAECETYVTTEDGSAGRAGFVTDVLRDVAARSSSVCACGPRAMLRAVAAMAERQNLPCQVSLEERMGCGIGACLVCACELQSEEGVRYGHVCKDGPVFNAQEVVW